MASITSLFSRSVWRRWGSPKHGSRTYIIKHFRGNPGRQEGEEGQGNTISILIRKQFPYLVEMVPEDVGWRFGTESDGTGQIYRAALVHVQIWPA